MAGRDAGRDARAQIRAAAERLIAERGADVPLRDIAVAANQRNNSAVQYHFGTRDELIAAIVEHGNTAQEERRLQLLADAEAAGGGEEVRELVELLVGPMMEIPYQLGSTHYARFLEQVRNHAAVMGDPGRWTAQSPAVRMIISRLDRALAESLPGRVRALRLTGMATAMFSLLADRERLIQAGHLDEAGAHASAANILDMLVAMLTGTPSADALGRAGGRRRSTRTA
jgi:AcrR family transcriptional regulator